MKYYNSILSCLVCLVIVFSSCESQSQEDTLSSLERIAHSDEYHAYSSADHDVFVFATSNPIDHMAILSRMDEYPQFLAVEDFAPELFADIPFGVEMHELQIITSRAMDILEEKFLFMSFSQDDRKTIRDFYKDLHKTFLTNEEVDAILFNHSKPD